MKKYLYLAIAAVAVAFAACGNDPDKPGKDDKNAAFTIDVADVTSTTATVTVTPKDAQATYYWSLLEKEAVDAINAGDYADEYGITDITSYATYMISYMVDLYTQYGYSITVADLLTTGEDTYDYDGLDPDVTYVVYAVASDAEGVCSGKAVTKEFATEAVQASTNHITLAYTNGKINITTTNDDTYFFWIESKEEYDAYQADFSETSVAAECGEWLATLAQYGYTEYAIMTGNYQLDPAADFWNTWFDAEKNPIVAGTEYVAMAVPYAGAINGAAVSLVFTYQPAAAAPAQVKAAKNVVRTAPAMRIYKAL